MKRSALAFTPRRWAAGLLNQSDLAAAVAGDLNCVAGILDAEPDR